jgi:hypothetical protein
MIGATDNDFHRKRDVQLGIVGPQLELRHIHDQGWTRKAQGNPTPALQRQVEVRDAIGKGNHHLVIGLRGENAVGD